MGLCFFVWEQQSRPSLGFFCRFKKCSAPSDERKSLLSFQIMRGLKKYNKTSLPYCRVLRAKSFRSCFSALCVFQERLFNYKISVFLLKLFFAQQKNVRWGCFEMQFSLVENIPWFCCVWCWLFKNRTREGPPWVHARPITTCTCSPSVHTSDE